MSTWSNTGSLAAASARSPVESGLIPPATVDWLDWEDRFVEMVRKVVIPDQLWGIPVALTVHNYLKLLLRSGYLKGPRCTWGGAAQGLARALAHPHALAGVRWPAPREWARLQRRVLIAGPHPHVRSRRWWQPLAQMLGPDRCLVLANLHSQLNQVSGGFSCLALTDFPAAWYVTRVWLLRRLPRWLRELRIVCAELGFDPPACWRLAADLVSQVNWLGSILAMERLLRPRAAVVLWDRERLGAALCAALARQGVPTVTFVHGAFGVQNHLSFVPLGARYVFTWGGVQNELLSAAGVASDRLLPVGVFEERPVSRELSPMERAERMRTLGLDPEKPIVVLGLTCLPEKDRSVWARLAQELADRLTTAAVLVRLHPSNRRAQFTGLLSESCRLRIVDDQEISLTECLNLADAVVVDSSSFGFDAVQRRIPVVVLRPPDGSGLLTVMREVVLAGAAVFARDAAEAVERLESLLTNSFQRAELAERAEAFTNRYVCAYGQDALNRAVEALERIALPTELTD